MKRIFMVLSRILFLLFPVAIGHAFEMPSVLDKTYILHI